MRAHFYIHLIEFLFGGDQGWKLTPCTCQANVSIFFVAGIFIKETEQVNYIVYIHSPAILIGTCC